MTIDAVYCPRRPEESPLYTAIAGYLETTGSDQFTLTGSSTPEDYPQTTTRIHEVAAVFKFKLTANLMPKFEYRFQQFDNRDYQTTPMTPYMGCVGSGSIVVSPPCVNVGATLALKSPSTFYPGFVVGDT